MKLNILIIILLFASCKCEYHVRKAKEGGCLANDTVILIDTIHGWSTDTVFNSDTTVLKAVDTFYLEKYGITVKTVVKWRERQITETVTKKDTVFKRVHHTVKEVSTVDKIPFWVYLVFCVGGVVILALALKK